MRASAWLAAVEQLCSQGQHLEIVQLLHSPQSHCIMGFLTWNQTLPKCPTCDTCDTYAASCGRGDPGGLLWVREHMEHQWHRAFPAAIRPPPCSAQQLLFPAWFCPPRFPPAPSTDLWSLGVIMRLLYTAAPHVVAAWLGNPVSHPVLEHNGPVLLTGSASGICALPVLAATKELSSPVWQCVQLERQREGRSPPVPTGSQQEPPRSR